MTPTERSPRKPSRKTGLSAALSSLLHASGTGAPSAAPARGVRNLTLTALVTLCTAACALLLVATPAGAAELPGLLREFGSFTHPTGVAIDQASGDVFVADSEGPEVVDVFSPGASGPSAVPLAVLGGTGSESFDFAGEPVGVAVDNSTQAGDPSKGDVYVTDVRHNLVDKFRLKGLNEYEYVCQIKGWYGTGEEACNPSGGTLTQPFAEPVGVTVDSSGNVYISSYGGSEHGFVAEFDSAGKGIMQLNSSEHSGLEGHPDGLAVDTAGDLFVQNFEAAGGHAEKVVRFTFSTPGVVTSETEIFEPASAIAIDPTNDHLYVDNNGAYALVFDSSGVLVESFASSPFGPNGSSKGLAVRGGTHEVYASEISRKDIEVLGLIKVPDVTPCEATELTPTSAKLTGKVNPLETAGAQYRFEYGLSSKYGSESSLTGIAGEGLMPVASEAIVGLAPGTPYHCRLDATDTAGLTAGSLFNRGPDAEFTTPPLPPEVPGTELSADVTAGGVLFKGSVNSGNGSTAYHFEYGRTTGYGTDLPDITVGPAGLEPIPVEQASDAPLEPGTLYHYALVAKNSSGEVSSADRTFTTPPAAPQPPETSESPEETFAAPAPPVALSLPATPLLLPAPVIEFPAEPGTIAPKPLTNAQKLAKALRQCAKRLKKKRPACQKQARSKYGPATRKRQK